MLDCDWGTALGTSNEAHRDGTCWSNAPADNAMRAQVLAVVPGSQHGWTATPNVLQVTHRGAAAWGFVEDRTKIPQGTSYCLRFYVRVNPATNVGANHPVKSSFAGGTIQHIWWAPHQLTGSTYRPLLNYDNAGGGGQRQFWGPVLQKGTWYLFVIALELFDREARRYRLIPTVYDLAGNPVGGPASYVNTAGQTLPAFHATTNGYGQSSSLDYLRYITFGMEGPAASGTPGPEQGWQYAAVAASTNGCPGPVQ